jgi:hypothetical protein
LEKGFECHTALEKWRAQKTGGALCREQVERDEIRRSLNRQLFDAALGGVQPHLQGVERECPADWHHEFTVEHEPARRQPPQQRGDFRKTAGKRLAGLGAQLNRRACAKRKAAKPVPFRFARRGRPPVAGLDTATDSKLGCVRQMRRLQRNSSYS